MVLLMLFRGCLSLHDNIFFFKQKTAYEMRISDWSSDVCSSDLLLEYHLRASRAGPPVAPRPGGGDYEDAPPGSLGALHEGPALADRKSVVSGKSVSVRVDLGGRRIIQKKNLINSISISMYQHITRVYNIL